MGKIKCKLTVPMFDLPFTQARHAFQAVDGAAGQSYNEITNDQHFKKKQGKRHIIDHPGP